jgi:hypothetical protein
MAQPDRIEITRQSRATAIWFGHDSKTWHTLRFHFKSAESTKIGDSDEGSQDSGLMVISSGGDLISRRSEATLAGAFSGK